MNQEFRKIVTLQIMVGVLADVYLTAGYSHSRSATTLLQVLNGVDAPEVVGDLGKLHRSFIWESILLKSSLSSGTTATKTTLEAPDAMSIVEDVLDTGEGSSAKADVEAEKRSPAIPHPNEKAVKFVVGLIPTSLTPFFQGM